MSNESLQLRFERYLRSLNKKHSGDPTVLSSFRADFESLVERIARGDTSTRAAITELYRIYQSHLPVGPDTLKRVPDPSARGVGGRGRFYRQTGNTLREVSPAQHGDPMDPRNNAYGEPGVRSLWLTYTRGARQAA